MESLNQHLLCASAVLHADIALGTHMEPSLKAILEDYRGDIEVIAQALKAKVLLLLHGLNMGRSSKKTKAETTIDFLVLIKYLGVNE